MYQNYKTQVFFIRQRNRNLKKNNCLFEFYHCKCSKTGPITQILRFSGTTCFEKMSILYVEVLFGNVALPNIYVVLGCAISLKRVISVCAQLTPSV